MRHAGIGLLSLFVFICSFIPIAGVFISTTPIAFVALTEYGFMKVRNMLPGPRTAAAPAAVRPQACSLSKHHLRMHTCTGDVQLAITIAMVIGIHFVEAYGLNPGLLRYRPLCTRVGLSTVLAVDEFQGMALRQCQSCGAWLQPSTRRT